MISQGMLWLETGSSWNSHKESQVTVCIQTVSTWNLHFFEH